jgi:hypothetical protein
MALLARAPTAEEMRDVVGLPGETRKLPLPQRPTGYEEEGSIEATA